MTRISILVLGLLVSAACSGRYLGIDDRTLGFSERELFERAKSGDKKGQFELGMRYIEGNGVEQDCTIGKRLLTQAARRSGGTTWVYSPPVTTGGQGRVIPIDGGPIVPGLQTAENVLNTLGDRGICVSE